jgi:hypothetical protein
MKYKSKDNIIKTCKIFDCKNLHYNDGYKDIKTSKNITRINRKSISYKITKPEVKNALNY